MDIPMTILKFIVYVIPILSAIYITIGIKLCKQKGEKKVNYFSMLMFACAIYSFGYFLELNWVSFNTLMIVRNFEFLGSVFIPTFGILFIAQLTTMKVTKKAAGILFSISTILWLLFITNPIHNLIYRSVDLEVIQGFAVISTVRGPVFYSMMAYYAYFLMFSSVILAKTYKILKNKRDKKSFRFMFITFQIPWLVILVILLGFDRYFDPVPATIMIVCGLIMLNEIKNDIFKLLISKWENHYEHIEELAFLVDDEGCIACSNMSAKRLFDELEMDTSNIITDMDNSKLSNMPVAYTIQNEVRWFVVHRNVFDSNSHYTTYLLIDVTEQMLVKKGILKSESTHKAMIAGISDVIGI